MIIVSEIYTSEMCEVGFQRANYLRCDTPQAHQYPTQISKDYAYKCNNISAICIYFDI